MTNHDEHRPSIAAGCDMRQRTPAEIAAQLERDASSLAMTGQSFEKDKAFYDHVAANIREGARLLARIPSEREIMRDHARQRYQDGYQHGIGWAAQMVLAIGDAMPLLRGPATAWRNACRAIVDALQARQASDSSGLAIDGEAGQAVRS